MMVQKLTILKMAYTTKQIQSALAKSKGNRTEAAKILGCSPVTIYNHVRRKPSLQAIAAQGLEERLDVAEGKLMELVREGNLGAVIFLLKTLGQSRGYVERSDVNIASKHEVTVIHQGEVPQIAGPHRPAELRAVS
jgi:hypothetical protein